MLRLTYSNNLGRLAHALVKNSPALCAGGTDLLFSSPSIVVPNRNLKTWLSFEIARTTGIAANISFLYLEEFLQSVLTDNGRAGVIITRDIIHSALISLFERGIKHDETEKLSDEVAAYIRAAESPDERDLRTYQLAAELSRVFEEYFLSRETMLQKWQQGNFVAAKEPFFSSERWQRSIWVKLFGTGGRLACAAAPDGRPYMTYPEALNQLSARTLVLPNELHLFGFSYMSRAYLRILSRIVQRHDVHVYALNPCREFWEDIRSRSEELREKATRIRRSRKLKEEELEASEDPFHLDDADETPALRLWGRPGREHIHILNSVTDCNFEEDFADPLECGTTLLRLLQRDILLREEERVQPPEGMDFSADESIRILACPGIQREVEVVANEIWALILRDDETERPDGRPLRFHDIAVIIADSAEYDTYRTHIASVFQEIHAIPHSISDTALAKDARVAEAVQLLLGLPLSSFLREDVLRLITHPSVAARFPEADADEWIAWAEKTGIFHGQSHEAHAGTYIEKDLYNWEQGTRRLSLGAFMSGLRSGNNKKTFSDALRGEEYLPEEFRMDSLDNAGLAVALVNSLHADARFALEQRMTFSDWATFLQGFITCYIGTTAEEDEHALAQCLNVVASLRQHQTDETLVSYRIAREFVCTGLAGLTGMQGQYLARGVSVSSFLPMRPIPFQVVFVLGLGEGRFPARDMRNPLDLRGARRMPGDVTARERDQYMFLETLISTRDRLYLSYVSRDSQTGEAIEPSSVVKEMQFMLERGYVGTEGMQRIIREHPLRRFDPEYFPSLFGNAGAPMPNFSPDALKEAAAAALSESLRAAGGGKISDRALVENKLPQAVRTLLGIADSAKPARAERDDAGRIPLRTIRKFLECPLQGWASFQLGLREEDFDDPVVRNEESFETSYMESLLIQREVFVKAWNSAAVSEENFDVILPDIYKEQVRISEMQGRTPTGFFKQAEMHRHLEVIQAWHAQLKADAESPNALIQALFGKGQESGEEKGEENIEMPSVLLDLMSGMRAELSGRSGLLSKDLLRAFVCRPKSEKSFKYTYLLQPFLDCACLSLLGKIADGFFAVHVLHTDGIKKIVFRIPGKDECRQFLETIVQDLREHAHDYLLPLDAVMDWKLQNKGGSLEDKITAVLSNTRQSNGCSFGPVRAADYSPPKDAEMLAERRLGLLFSSIIEEKEEKKQ
ncbi:MAG: exonuclease V (RecBCD complex) subunit gamma [Nitrospirae bacterium]|nr:MAG: exonuclease V (RecBCD complex) subunit gamma [Nitrospirota bacterium]